MGTLTVAISMSKSSHHNRSFDILLATRRNPTATSGSAKKTLKIAYNFGAWLSSRGPEEAAIFFEDEQTD